MTQTVNTDCTRFTATTLQTWRSGVPIPVWVRDFSTERPPPILPQG